MRWCTPTSPPLGKWREEGQFKASLSQARPCRKAKLGVCWGLLEMVTKQRSQLQILEGAHAWLCPKRKAFH